MAKNRSKQSKKVRAPEILIEVAATPHLEWETIETEFFARESDLYRVAAVDSFEDLEKD